VSRVLLLSIDVHRFQYNIQYIETVSDICTCDVGWLPCRIKAIATSVLGVTLINIRFKYFQWTHFSCYGCGI